MDRCRECSLDFSLDVMHDGNEDEVKVIYSSDLRCSNPNVQMVNYSNRDEERLDQEELSQAHGIAICKLGKGQKLKFEATAFKGISKIHSKWSPVCVATFAYLAEVKLDEGRMDELTKEQKYEFVQSCPKKVFNYDEQSQKVKVKDSEACVFCDECVKLGETWKRNKDDDALVVVRPIPEKFLFSVEVTGALSPVEVVILAMDTLSKKLQYLKDNYDKLDQNGEDLEDAPGAYVDTGGFV